MIIVSYQKPDILPSIERDGVACCKSPEFALGCEPAMFAYNWMARKMREKVGPPPRDGVEYPLWGWAQQGCSRKEIRPSGNDFSTGDDRLAMLTLDIPEDRLLLSDFNDWHAPLNQFPLYDPDNAGRKLLKYIDSFNIPSGTGLKDYPKELRDRIVSTWDLIFDLDRRGKCVQMRRNRTIQATFWEIRKEWIKDVRILDAKAYSVNH